MFPKQIILLVLAIAITLSMATIIRARLAAAVRAPAVTRPWSAVQAIQPAVTRPTKPTWNQMNVPEHSAWAKNVLLIVVWMFVLAVLAGPLVKYAANRKPSPPRPPGGAW